MVLSYTRLPRSACRHSDKSNRPTADYLNQKTVRDRPCAVLDDAPLRCAVDLYPPASVHRSRDAGVGTRHLSAPFHRIVLQCLELKSVDIVVLRH